MSPSGQSRSQQSCFVTIAYGAVQGVDRGSSCAFLGVPYAAPPVGQRRWKPPQSAACWAPATLDATHAPSPCPSISPPGSATVSGAEDCLRLNIWAPDPPTASPAPVIVWMHAGAFYAGSANMTAHDGRKLAERTGTIVVAVNYRLGPFGFLGHSALTAEDPEYRSSGNYGFLDQRAALAWVRDNIAAFGGNPRNVTIAGQSAGAHSVSLHLVSPRSAGYFGRAIMQSGYASTRWRTLADAESQGREFAAALGCTDASRVLSCLRAKTPEEVLLALPSGQQQIAETARASWGPVVDGLDIPDQPRTLYERGAFTHVPIIIGATRDEGWEYVDRSFPAGLSKAVYAATVESEFGANNVEPILTMYPESEFPSPKHALAALAGDVEAVCEARRIARLVERAGPTAYLYSFEREPDAALPKLVVHGRDTNFVFGNNFERPPNVLDARDLELAAAMGGYWARFAAMGNPNATGTSLEWPRAHLGGRAGGDQHLVFDWPIRHGLRLRERQCDFWEPFFFSSVVGAVPASQR